MLKGLARNTKKITYTNLDSALRPVPHDLSMPAQLLPEDGQASLADEVVFDEDSSSAPSDLTGFGYEPQENLKPILFFPEQ